MNKSFIKYLFVLACLIVSIFATQAQSFDDYKKWVQSEFDQYKSNKEREFTEYRDRINAEFAEYMRQAWPEFQSKPADPMPDSPEPPTPVIKNPDIPPSNDPVPFDKITPVPEPVRLPVPFGPMPEPEPETPTKPMFTFAFYGEKCSIPLENGHKFTLSGVNEDNVADGWMILSSDRYLPVVAKCLDYREKLRLCDWGYLRFVEQMTMAFFSSAHQNEARLMQMYILTQSGYKVRIAKTGKNLVLLLPSQDTIYDYTYLTVRGCRYYVVDKSLGQALFNVLDREYPKEQFFSLRISELPALPVNRTVARHFQSRHDKELTADVSVNKNLIDFYDDYPLNPHWNIYAGASLSVLVKEQLYPVLEKVIAGKNRLAAANILLHFVQTAFEYETDEKQFGTERPLFADETMYYPYSDCEDRAILYSVLVRELLGLDVVLLYYPGHLATAVCFDADTPGDYLYVDGKRYIVCDPTYINANIGEAMPQFKQTSANVVKIK